MFMFNPPAGFAQWFLLFSFICRRGWGEKRPKGSGHGKGLNTAKGRIRWSLKTRSIAMLRVGHNELEIYQRLSFATDSIYVSKLFVHYDISLNRTKRIHWQSF